MRATRVLTGRRVIKEGYSPQEFYLTGAEQSPASDLYSLGATFFHVITGKAPPESQRRLARVAEGEPDPYPALAGRYEGYPPGFLESIDKAVRVMPRDRIQTAGDWLDWIRISEEGGTVPDGLTKGGTGPRAAPMAEDDASGSRRVGFLALGAGVILAAVAATWWALQ